MTYIPPVDPEIGPALKVSDLHVGDVVCIHKSTVGLSGRAVVTARVTGIWRTGVAFQMGGITFLAKRTEDDRVTDDAASDLYLYTYLGI
jgi:hypothetical protein